ncbi:hypothetical protein [Sneathiella limimaris]|uniref:hypothetical protein n=1 Tax=Sneathiella limimaris TaxID=1964213 RepID=UPI001469CF8E|nr:hypothetical protein [Sneathiella limimaris]
MEKYLHLSEGAHATTWVNGGSIPLKVASTYYEQERHGTQTLDEGLTIQGIEVSQSIRNPVVRDGNRVSVGPLNLKAKKVLIENCTFENTYSPFEGIIERMHVGRVETWDGLVFCCSNRYSVPTALKFKKHYCVKILDIDALKKVLDNAVGDQSNQGPCNYVHGISRDPFTKSIEDKWQNEYRLFWPDKENTWVDIPSGLAVPYANLEFRDTQEFPTTVYF